jgi:hypothetical protein
MSLTVSAPHLSDLRDIVEKMEHAGVPDDARVTKIKQEKAEQPYPSYLTVAVEWEKSS